MRRVELGATTELFDVDVNVTLDVPRGTSLTKRERLTSWFLIMSPERRGGEVLARTW